MRPANISFMSGPCAANRRPAHDSRIRCRREAGSVAMKQGRDGWSCANDRLAARAWEGRSEADHHIGRLDDRIGFLALLELQFIDRFVVIEAATTTTTAPPPKSMRTCAVVAPW